MKKQKAEYRIGVGASSILMILVVLALAAVALLAYSSAANNKALSDRSVEMTASYYQASAEAQRKLAALDETVAESSASSLAELRQAFAAIDELSDVSLAEIGGVTSFSFSVDAGADRSLDVAGTLSFDGAPRYVLTRHRLVSHSQASDEPDYLDLLKP